ncbi:mechanosensitive ion channel family protein [Thermosipho ferrireducens]|uniref:Mechanosensitive ion channel family protein n=1 Tax=Thermosipho ferrireducens TaxID=2571116 RepID=A0ABX7S8R8_9BACT|nr:mechanosensitive ion channel family protein [Thermosipho ferrireducens]QTA38185.1 mechanosensitive ion channel family protein [Thermosipho ferrireducens]
MGEWLLNNWDKIFWSFITIIISLFIYKYILKVLKKTLETFGKDLRAPKTVQFFIGIIIAVFAIFALLSIWNVDLLPYITGLGISSIVVGLALQEPLANFVSGILVITTRKLFEGEVVDVNGIVGSVQEIKMNHSLIKTFDGKLIYVPNRAVWNGIVTKFWPGPIRRITMEIGVSYDCNLEKVVKILQQALDEEPLVVKNNTVSNFVAFKRFGSSSIDFTVYFWVERANYFDAVNSLAFRIKNLFDKENIEIPYTQIDLHIKNEKYL